MNRWLLGLFLAALTLAGCSSTGTSTGNGEVTQTRETNVRYWDETGRVQYVRQ
jgi:hypothetical protein